MTLSTRRRRETHLYRIREIATVRSKWHKEIVELRNVLSDIRASLGARELRSLERRR